MMWKESYRTGIELVDTQHKELFDMIEKLLKIAEAEDAEARRQECISAITFLKDYVIKHFAAEEEYQQSINYSDIEAHKTLHRIFVTTIENLTIRLFNSEFAVPVAREFGGILTTWFIYHVIGADQKLKTNERLRFEKVNPSASYAECFAQSAASTLETMAGLPAGNVTFAPFSGKADDIRVMIGLVGNHEGEAIFTYSREIAFNLIKAMTSMQLTEVDELVCSALSETTNIISGNASSLIAESGKTIDITTPKIISDFPMINTRSDGFYLDTDFGSMAVSVNVI